MREVAAIEATSKFRRGDPRDARRTKSSAAMTEIATAPTACEAPTRPVRVIWHEVACPAAHQLDATELQVGKLLEAADAIVALGLPAAGFHTLALENPAFAPTVAV